MSNKIKPNCEKCYYSGVYYSQKHLASCDNPSITEPVVIKHDDLLNRERRCVRRSAWNEECECNQFVPLLSEQDNDFELEQEVIFNTEFDCPFCGEKIDVCDVSVANVQLITCDNCNKLIAVDGGDY